VLLAARGHRVTGIDVARRAVEIAGERAVAAGVRVDLVLADMLALDGVAVPGAPFDSAIDIGMFHVLQPADRRAYARALAGLVRPGGEAFVVAWSDRNPFGYGPERVSRRALRSSFRRAEGWRVAGIEPERLETRLEPGVVHAWLATIRRR
jgi:cyclopropane fatty-acyl-phospholipid synthase-like methyltransferase